MHVGGVALHDVAENVAGQFGFAGLQQGVSEIFAHVAAIRFQIERAPKAGNSRLVLSGLKPRISFR